MRKSALHAKMTKHFKEGERLRKIVESFPKVTVTVLGDLVADEFIFGEISRVSREAPVLILSIGTVPLCPEVVRMPLTIWSIWM